MSPKNVEYLEENGPSTAEELPNTGVSVNDRKHGVWRFAVLDGNPNNLMRGGLKTTVYYLPDEHSPEDVIRKWAESNWKVVENTPVYSLRYQIKQFGSDFSEAVDNVFPSPGERGVTASEVVVGIDR